MLHVAQYFFGSGNDTWISWHTGRIEDNPSDEMAKNLVTLNDMTSNQKKQYNNYKMNTRAYADLLRCCTQDIVSFGIVDTAKDKDLMNGNGNDCLKSLLDVISLKR